MFLVLAVGFLGRGVAVAEGEEHGDCRPKDTDFKLANLLR